MASPINYNPSKKKGNERIVVSINNKLEADNNDPENLKIVQNNKEIADIISTIRQKKNMKRNLSLPSYDEIKNPGKSKAQALVSPSSNEGIDKYPTTNQNTSRNMELNSYRKQGVNFSNAMHMSQKKSKVNLYEQEKTEGDLDRTDNTIESVLIAKTKLERDKIIVSNSIGQMRDISYLYESIQKSQTTKNANFQKPPNSKFFNRRAKETLYSPETLYVNNSAHLVASRASNNINTNILNTPNSYAPDISPIKNVNSSEYAEILQNNNSSGKKANQVIQNFNINMSTINNFNSPDPNRQSVQLQPLTTGFNHLSDLINPKDFIVPPIFKYKAGDHFAPQIWNGTPYKNISSNDKKKIIEEDDLLSSLQKEVPGLFTYAPASRNDIFALKNWMNNEIKKIDEDAKLDHRSKLLKCDDIYNIALNESLRQISIEFNERADIFYSIWSTYIGFFEKFRKQAFEDIDKTKENYALDNQRQCEDLNLKLLNYEKLFRENKKEVDELQQKVKELVAKNEEISNKEAGYKEKLSQCKKGLKKQREMINHLKEENKFYSIRNNFRMVIAKKHDANVLNIPGRGIGIGSTSKFSHRQKSQNSLGSIMEPMSARKFPNEKIEEPAAVDSSEYESDASSIDIVYNGGDSMNQVVKLDQLNNAVSYKADYKTYANLDIRAAGTQTDISLMTHEFDDLFASQMTVNDLITDLKLKREVDVFSKNEHALISAKKLTDIFLMHPVSYGLKNKYEDKLDGIYSPWNSTKMDISQDMDEDDKSKQSSENKSGTTTPVPGNTAKRGSILIIPETVREEEEDENLNQVDGKSSKSITHLDDHPTLNDSKTDTQQDTVSRKGSLMMIDDRSGSKDEQDSIEQDHEPETTAPKEQDNIIERGPVKRAYSLQKFSKIKSEPRLDNLLHSETDGVFEEISKMPEVKTDSHQDTWSSEDHSDASSNLTHVESSGNSNLSSFLAIRSKVKRMVSDIKSPEDSNINDKAKLLQYMRMYKVEFEKNKMLSDNIIALQDHALNDKETIDKLQESITELKEQLRVGMAHVGVCSHGKCPDCEAQKIRESPQADEEAEEEIDLDEDSKEEKDEAEDSRNTPSDGNKIKKPRRKNNATPDFLKKKEAQINPGPIIIAKLKSKNFSKFKNFLPSKIILKQIQALYHERVTKTREFPNTREEEFSCFTYNFFLNNFGFKKLAEQKFIVFILSLKKYLHIIRINLFARFLGLLNGAGNYNLDEFNKYIEALDFLNSSTLGHHILNNESDPKHYTPFIRCLDYIKIFSENKLSQQEFLEFKKELEILKQPDLKRMNRLGIIDIDLFMTRVLLKYRLICNRTKKHVISAFRAADLDGNKYCSFKEFDTIYKYIEAEKYDKNFVSNLFYEHADSKVEEQNNLSFDKFTIVCVEYSLFTDAQQENFLGVKTPDNLLKMMDDIKFGWVMKSLALSENIYALKNISEEDREFWLQILKVLGEKITKSEVSYDDAKPLLIAYKMLLTEIETLKDQEAARDVYGIKIETHPDEFLQNSEINNDQDVEKSEVVPEEIEENVS